MDYVGVSQYLQDADLSSDPFYVWLIDYLLFLQDLYCYFLASWDVDTQLHLAEGSLS